MKEKTSNRSRGSSHGGYSSELASSFKRIPSGGSGNFYSLNRLFLLCFLFAVATVHAEQRNVLLITIDTLRADHLSCNGSNRVTTPNLDRLAGKGVNFTRVRSPVPITLPSHASILTSLYPFEHGIRDNGGSILESKHKTFAEILNERRYQTAAFVGSFVLDHRFGLAQGFQIYDDHTSENAAMLENAEAERNADAVLRAFSTWFAKRDKSKPFFAWVHFYDPHTPYEPPEPFTTKYSRDRYAGEIAYTDSVIGKLLQQIDTNKTVVGAVGDHGEGRGDHQEPTHSVLTYNSTLHVPMILSAPGLIPSGIEVTALCRTIDLAPTLLDYLGFTSEFGKGTSLRSVISAGSMPALQSYSESLYPNLNFGWSELYGYEEGNYHFILAPKPELYDVIKDPQEKANLYFKLPDVAKAFQQKLKSMIPATPVTTSEVDAETREKLLSLGYVSGSSPSKQSQIDPKDKIHILNELQPALEDFSGGNFQKAAQGLEKILAKEKDLLLVYDYLGSAYLRLEKWPEAEKCYRQAHARGLEWSGQHVNLGRIYLQRNELSKAQEEFQKAIALDQLNVTAYYYLGKSFHGQKAFQKAIEQYQKALSINPSYVFAQNALGMSYAAVGKNAEAVQAFRDVIRLDPRAAQGYLNLAVQLERMKQFKEATENYRKALQLSTDPQQRQTAAQAIERLKGQTQ